MYARDALHLRVIVDHNRVFWWRWMTLRFVGKSVFDKPIFVWTTQQWLNPDIIICDTQFVSLLSFLWSAIMELMEGQFTGINRIEIVSWHILKCVSVTQFYMILLQQSTWNQLWRPLPSNGWCIDILSFKNFMCHGLLFAIPCASAFDNMYHGVSLSTHRYWLMTTAI